MNRCTCLHLSWEWMGTCASDWYEIQLDASGCGGTQIKVGNPSITLQGLHVTY